MTSSAHHIEVKAVRLPNGLGLPLPQYQTDGAAGMDLMAAVPLTAPLRLLPGMRQQVPTGLAIEIPPGFEGQVRPRSGLALNHGVTVLNAPGTIDCDYRGELKVLLVNLGRETFVITRGQRIAQLVVAAVVRVEMVDVRAVAASRRGEAGFGSTGSGAAGGIDSADVAVVGSGAAAKLTAPASKVRKPVAVASVKAAAAASSATPSKSAAPLVSGSGKSPAAGMAARKPAFAPANNPGHTDRGAKSTGATKSSGGKVAAQEEPPAKELPARVAGNTAAGTKKAVSPAVPRSASANMAPSKSATGKSSPAKGKASSRA